MNIIQAIFSGVLQGLTEFLPVSSSGHLVLLHNYFGYKEPQLFFDIFLHVGTLFSVLIYFHKDIYDIMTKKRKYIPLLLSACISTGVIVFLFENFFISSFYNIALVGVMFLVTAVLLFAAHLKTNKNAPKSKVNFAKALVIGAVQGAAVLPGLSRSGATVSTALFCGIEKDEAVKFSFLLSAPAIAGALFFEILKSNSIQSINIANCFFGAIAAFLTGLFAISFFIKILKKNKMYVFSIYCLILGLITLKNFFY